MLYIRLIILPALASLFILVSCGGNDTRKETVTKKDSTKSKKEIKAQTKTVTNIQKPPIINIVDTISPKRMIVYISDSASTYERISIKLGQIYGFKLADVFKKNALKVMAPPMAWYQTQKPPYFFEAGVPVNKKPTKLILGAKIKELPNDSAVVAHFYGPYNLMYMGYDALKEWMKDHKKKAVGAPYEIYITDPIDKKGKPVDPYKVQTDIVFPRK